MRKQIAAANWKMNLTYQDAEKLLDDILKANIEVGPNQQVLFAVPFPYLIMTKSEVDAETGYAVAAQNCHHKASGAFTGEVSVDMLRSIGVQYCVIGHSERREYFGETNALLAEKADRCLEAGITPLFCCGEPLDVRESGDQNRYVSTQLEESLFHLSEEQVRGVVIAYEPIWAIGTGEVATPDDAQEVCGALRRWIAEQFDADAAAGVRILYGGSVKAGSTAGILAGPDIDGALVGGASLDADEFAQICRIAAGGS
jgi:triosephosphate isomerase (TIM)